MMLRRTLTLAALGFAVAGGAQAQTARENSDADALAADMRILAANPLNIEALITAGELTLRMGDSTAAATFFGRAEKLDPNNPRIKAGWGSLMVRAERPGMALVRFQEAERRGLDVRKYAADRGLAYDLIGEQERAQRDYRLALQAGPDDEVTRRYALSLGISGNKDEALKLLDPLLKKSDRAAWRDRAFVLAMSGDVPGAEKIAETMMSPGLGAGLTPFFRRLLQLSPADRAFAVTFGETRPTPERIVDAKLVPPLPRLGPDPYAPKVVAAVVAPVAAPVVDDGRKRKKRRKDQLLPVGRQPVPEPVEVAAVTPPAYEPPRAAPTPTPAPVPPPVRVAAAVPKPTPVPPPGRVPAAEVAVVAPTPSPAPAPTAPVAPVAVRPSMTVAPPAAPVRGTADQPSAAEAGVPQPTATSRVSEDSVLARIVAGLDKPPPAPAPKPRRAPVETPPPVEVRAKPQDTKIADAKTGAAKAKDQLTDARGRPVKPKDDEPALDKNGCPIPPKPVKGKVVTPVAKARSAMTAREKANDTRCKAATAKAKADAETKGEPARAWVQVAGGANEGDLKKAWAALQSKSPDLFRGRQGWSTPLRATNRVLTGPFKTADEAQAFVNRMAKAGLSGFVFTSAKGQKVVRLGSN